MTKDQFRITKDIIKALYKKQRKHVGEINLDLLIKIITEKIKSPPDILDANDDVKNGEFVVMGKTISKEELADEIRKDLPGDYVGGGDLIEMTGEGEASEWYSTRTFNNTSYWNRYEKYLIEVEQKVSSESVAHIDTVTTNILNKCGDPSSNEDFDKRGLVVGYVQSGKTGNFMGVINKAVDSGYKIVIILSGIHENLRGQTQERIESNVIGKTTKNEGHDVGVGELWQIADPRILTITQFKQDYKGGGFSGVGLGDQTLVFVIKKNKSVLEALQKDLKSWLKGNKTKKLINNQNSKINYPLLMIDDEADQASLDIAYKEAQIKESKPKISDKHDATLNEAKPKNINKAANDEEAIPSSEIKPSTINSLIRGILELFSQKTYIGYTATPFANIFASLEKDKDYGFDLFPRDFIIMINRPKNYMGPVEVFGITTDNDQNDSSGLPLTRILDAKEYRDDKFSIYHTVENKESIETVVKNYQEHLADLIRWNHLPTNVTKKEFDEYYSELEGTEIYVGEGFLKGKNSSSSYDPGERLKELNLWDPIDLPLSLKTAINSFILSCAARLIRKHDSKHFSMLIHVSRFTNVQNKLKEIIKTYTETLFAKIKANDTETIDELKALWEDDFIPTSKIMSQDAEPYKYYDGKVHKWTEVKKKLVDVINFLTDESEPNVRVIHGSKAEADLLNYSDHEEDGGLKVIAIGGNKLSRGLTVEGLMVSYYMRSSNYYDTLMQMGRWFGYRPHFADLVRVFVTAELNENYRHIATAFEELRNLFEEMSRDKKNTPMQFGLRVLSHPKLQVTNMIKARNSKSMKISFSEVMSSTIILQNSEKIIKDNTNTAINLIKSIGKPDKVLSRSYKGKIYRPIWSNVDSKKIIEFFSNYKTHSDSSLVHASSIKEYIEKANKTKKKDLINWKVVLFSNIISDWKSKDLREFTKDFKVLPMNRLAKDASINDYVSTGSLVGGADRFLYLPEDKYSKKKAEFETLPEDSKIKKAGIRAYMPQLNCDEALLIIIPVKFRQSDDPTPYPNLSEIHPLNYEKFNVGFGVNFPKSSEDISASYRINEIERLKLEIGIKPETEDSEELPEKKKSRKKSGSKKTQSKETTLKKSVIKSKNNKNLAKKSIPKSKPRSKMSEKKKLLKKPISKNKSAGKILKSKKK